MIVGSMPPNKMGPDLASASASDTLLALHVDPESGLTSPEVDARRKEDGYNEVTERRGHPFLKFLGKFWGVSAWMLELIMVLSAVLGKYADLAVVSALLVVNAVLSFMQESRAAGVVETLRRRLQVSARVLRDASWQVIPAREVADFPHIGRHSRQSNPSANVSSDSCFPLRISVAHSCPDLSWPDLVTELEETTRRTDKGLRRG